MCGIRTGEIGGRSAGYSCRRITRGVRGGLSLLLLMYRGSGLSLLGNGRLRNLHDRGRLFLRLTLLVRLRIPEQTLLSLLLAVIVVVKGGVYKRGAG